MDCPNCGKTIVQPNRLFCPKCRHLLDREALKEIRIGLSIRMSPRLDDFWETGNPDRIR